MKKSFTFSCCSQLCQVQCVCKQHKWPWSLAKKWQQAQIDTGKNGKINALRLEAFAATANSWLPGLRQVVAFIAIVCIHPCLDYCFTTVFWIFLLIILATKGWIDYNPPSKEGHWFGFGLHHSLVHVATYFSCNYVIISFL